MEKNKSRLVTFLGVRDLNDMSRTVILRYRLHVVPLGPVAVHHIVGARRVGLVRGIGMIGLGILLVVHHSRSGVAAAGTRDDFCTTELRTVVQNNTDTTAGSRKLLKAVASPERPANDCEFLSLPAATAFVLSFYQPNIISTTRCRALSPSSSDTMLR